MKVFCILATVLALTALTQAQAEADAEDTVGTKSFGVIQKAPSNRVSCNCQCDNYTYKGDDNRIHGNCFTADHTRGKWCYVDQYSGDCGDIQYSQNRRDSYGNLRKWSYQACSTPERGSYQCRNNGNFNNNNGFGNNNNGFGNNNNGFGNNNNNNNNGFGNNNNGFGNNNNGFGSNGNRPGRRPGRRPNNNRNPGNNNNFNLGSILGGPGLGFRDSASDTDSDAIQFQ